MKSDERINPRTIWHKLLKTPFVRRNCPVCGLNKEALLFVGDSHNIGLRNVICRACGHIYVNPAPSNDWLTDFYESVYRLLYNSAAQPTDEYLQRHNPIDTGIQACMEWLCESGNQLSKKIVLDIGCAEGAYLKEIRRLLDVNLIGFETSLPFALFAQDHLPDATIIAENFSAKKFLQYYPYADIVIAAHVLEHILDPLLFLQEIRTILHPDGILYLEVPVGDRKKVKNTFHIAHLNHFTRSSLPWLLQRAGFELSQIDSQGTRGGAGGAYRLLASTIGDGDLEISDELIGMANKVIEYQVKHFLPYRIKMMPNRFAKIIFGRRPETLL